MAKLRLKEISNKDKVDNLIWMMRIKGKRNRTAQHQGWIILIPILILKFLNVMAKEIKDQ
jgi:hypothetical protein